MTQMQQESQMQQQQTVQQQLAQAEAIQAINDRMTSLKRQREDALDLVINLRVENAAQARAIAGLSEALKLAQAEIAELQSALAITAARFDSSRQPRVGELHPADFDEAEQADFLNGRPDGPARHD